MSLLTKRQIADILDILNVCGTTTRARDLEQWNEKQQPLAQSDLLAALMLAKDMMIANDLSLPYTFEVIDKAITKARGE